MFIIKNINIYFKIIITRINKISINLYYLIEYLNIKIVICIKKIL